MSAGIRDRVRRLSGSDRLLLLLTGVSTVAGIPGNYVRTHGLAAGLQAFLFLFVVVVWAAVVVIIAWSVIRQQRRLAEYGFSFKRGGLVSLAAGALIHVYLVLAGAAVPFTTRDFLLKAVGASMEEIMFRVVAIDGLILLMNRTKARAFGAILASSALWSIPHAVSKSPAQLLLGIFLGGLILGYIYYKSRSILLPAWIHSVAHAGYMGGLLVVVSYCAISTAAWAVESRRRQVTRVASANT